MAGSQVTLTQPDGIVFGTSITQTGYRVKLYFHQRVFDVCRAGYELEKLSAMALEFLRG